MPSKDSDQPGHPPSLISLRCALNGVDIDPSFLHSDSEDSDQTGQMPRLIQLLAGRTCGFVGFVVRRLRLVIRLQSRGYEFTPQPGHIILLETGHSIISPPIVSLRQIQARQLSITGEVMCT